MPYRVFSQTGPTPHSFLPASIFFITFITTSPPVFVYCLSFSLAGPFHESKVFVLLTAVSPVLDQCLAFSGHSKISY